MLINLVDKICWEWLATESVQQVHPSIQFRTSVIVAHSGGVVLNNLYELTHDLREEDDSTKHEDNANNLFS